MKFNDDDQPVYEHITAERCVIWKDDATGVEVVEQWFSNGSSVMMHRDQFDAMMRCGAENAEILLRTLPDMERSR